MFELRMTKTAPNVRGLEAEAYHQGGYFTSAQAREHAVSSQLLNHHVRQGRFKRLRRGLYRIPGFPSSQHDEIREKWLAVGPEKALVSHESALALLELSDNIPDHVHLLVPRRHRGLRRPAGVVIHTHPDNETIESVWRDGMPVTAPARTLIDVANDLQPEQAALAARQALGRGLLTRKQLEHEAVRRGQPHLLEALLPWE